MYKRQILQQIGGKRFTAMTGSRDFIDMGNGLDVYKIQVLMLQNDIGRMQADPNFSLDSIDGVYIVFLCIGIIGYFTIPTVAGWIIPVSYTHLRYRFMSSVSASSIFAVPCTTGERMLFIVPSTTVGKNMMHRPCLLYTSRCV